jgi:hypothetical protein
MKKHILVFSLFVVSVLLFSCKGANGPVGSTPEGGWYVKTYQQGVDGFGGCYDDRIWDGTPAVNYGNDTVNWVGVNSDTVKRLLIEFNTLAGTLPAGAVIEKASISLKTMSLPNGSPVFKFYAMNTSWDESSATWLLRYTGNSWTTPGGVFPAVAVSNSVAVTAASTWYTWSVDKSVIQNGIAGTNYGFILKEINETGTNEAYFAMKDIASVENRPMLTIYYSLP